MYVFKKRRGEGRRGVGLEGMDGFIYLPIMCNAHYSKAGLFLQIFINKTRG
jgi:hypothetical protein